MNALIEQYLGIWNERDTARRTAAIKEALTEDSVYSDPDYPALRGHEALSETIGQAQQKFGDLTFTLGEIIAAHHDMALFTWRLGSVATGHDYMELRNGRISRVVGFF
jgi:hypothetical protein